MVRTPVEKAALARRRRNERKAREAIAKVADASMWTVGRTFFEVQALTAKLNDRDGVSHA